MGDPGIVRDGQCRSDADAVVRAERGLFGDHPVVLDHDVDPTLAWVVRALRLPLADHVEVRLEDDGRRCLASRRRRNLDDHVAFGIRRRLEAARVRPREDVLAGLRPPASTDARSS